MDFIQIAASVLAGSTLSAVLAKAFIAKNLRDLEHAIDKIAEIRTELAGIAVRLEVFEKAHTMIQNIDRKIVALEMIVYGRSKSSKGHSPEGVCRE